MRSRMFSASRASLFFGLLGLSTYTKVDALNIAIAFITDPWGTYIELTEGLNKVS
jgi:hypothetical protein